MKKRSISIAIILMAVMFSGCSSTSAITNVDEQVPANGELDTEASEVQDTDDDILLIEDFWKEDSTDSNNALKFVTGLEIIFPDSWNEKTVHSVDTGPANDPTSTTLIVCEKTNAEEKTGVLFYLHLWLHEEDEIQYIFDVDKVLGLYEQGDKEYILVLAMPRELCYVEGDEERKSAYEELSSTVDSVIIKTDNMTGFTQYDNDDLEWIQYQ